MKNNMGGGSYSYNTSVARAEAVYKSMDRSEVFTSTSLNPQMDIKNKVRECIIPIIRILILNSIFKL